MQNKSQKKKGRVASVICRLFGSIILIFVILSVLPVTLPRFMGYEIYSVASGSMEPEIPVGSIVYVKAVENPLMIEEGEIVAFVKGNSVIMHRVVFNHQVDEYLTTKGDANEQEDIGEVLYTDVVGRVVRHLPLLGQIFQVYTSSMGKILMVCFALSGVLLHVLAGMLERKPGAGSAADPEKSGKEDNADHSTDRRDV